MRAFVTFMLLLYAAPNPFSIIDIPMAPAIVAQEEEPENDELPADNETPEVVQAKYLLLRDSIGIRQQQLALCYTSAVSDSARKAVIKDARAYLLQTLAEDVFPCWYGTIWDFNGTTEIPQDGMIACGYFITTTLKHAGFNLQRYKLAQQASSNIVKSLCTRKSIRWIGHANLDGLVAHAKEQEEGLFIVGLDYHVGYLLKYKNKLRFVHSTFLSPGEVVSEPVATSDALQTTNNFVIGNMLGNDDLIVKWLKGSSVPTITR